MRYRIFTALGVLAAITGLASSVQAQSTVASNSRSGEFTLSGESLTNINNRTVQNDFNGFFLENSPTTIPSSIGTAPNSIGNNSTVNNNTSSAQRPGVLQISEDVELVSNEPLSHPVSRVPGQQNQPFVNVERARVELNVAR